MTDDESLALAAYSACFRQYGHAQTRNLKKAFAWIGEEQRAMWRDVAKAVLEQAAKQSPERGER